MAAKLVKFSQEARDKILRGVNVLADAVTVTLGPRVATSSSRSRSGPPTSPKTG